MVKKWTKREKYLGGALGLFVLVSLVLGFDKLGFSLGDEKMVTVTRVIDGDTVDFSDGTHGRLIGIDAPEYPKGCLSKRAKDRLEQLVLGREVKVEMTGERSFERGDRWFCTEEEAEAAGFVKSKDCPRQ